MQQGFSTLLLIIIIVIVEALILPIPQIRNNQLTFSPPLAVKLIEKIKNWAEHPEEGSVASPLSTNLPAVGPRFNQRGEICPQGSVLAVDPVSFECHQYSSVCDIPQGWSKVNQCPNFQKVISCGATPGSSTTIQCPIGYYCKTDSKDSTARGICVKS